jgi:hypothetical protein
MIAWIEQMSTTIGFIPLVITVMLVMGKETAILGNMPGKRVQWWLNLGLYLAAGVSTVAIAAQVARY